MPLLPSPDSKTGFALCVACAEPRRRRLHGEPELNRFTQVSVLAIRAELELPGVPAREPALALA